MRQGVRLLGLGLGVGSALTILQSHRFAQCLNGDQQVVAGDLIQDSNDSLEQYLIDLHMDTQNNAQWKHISNESDGIKVYYYRKPKAKTGLYKITVKLKIDDPKYFWENIDDKDPINRQKWDNATVESIELKRYGKNLWVSHLRSNSFAGGLISGRDIVEVNLRTTLKSGKECYIAQSAELVPNKFNLPLPPVLKGCVRALLHFSSLETKKVEDEVELEFIASSDAAGYLPMLVVEAAMKNSLIHQTSKLKALSEQKNELSKKVQKINNGLF